MRLKEWTAINPQIIIPNNLKGKIQVFANCELQLNEIYWYNNVLECISNHIIKDNINLDSFYCLAVFFLGDNEITLYEEDNHYNGFQFYSALYYMSNLRKRKNNAMVIFSFTEELVHYFWRMYNEKDAKIKTLKIVNDMIPELTFDILKGWELNGI